MRESLYKQITRELAQQIVMGIFTPGSLFPVEMELCETWQVSRHTMHGTLRESTEQGLTSRRRGAGTRVCEPRASGASHLLSHPEDLLLPVKSNLRIIKKADEIVVDIESSQMIGYPPGSRWLYIASACEDTQNLDTPIRWTDSYASTDYAELRTYIRDDPYSSISDLIETHYGIKSHKVHQTITAIGVLKEVIKTFNVASDSPVVGIVCRYLDRDGRVSKTTISVHSAGRYTYSIVLRSQSSRE